MQRNCGRVSWRPTTSARPASWRRQGRSSSRCSRPRCPVFRGSTSGAAMRTATEVGGDYYDFRVEPDGTLLVALGDATGHGVSAGIVVTAVKAIFTSLEGAMSLPGILARCSGVLQGMHTGPVRMCLTLARVQPKGVSLCAAAMPPMLVYRAATAEVEEIVTSSLPLGGPLADRYEERIVPLTPAIPSCSLRMVRSNSPTQRGSSWGSKVRLERFARLSRVALPRLSWSSACWPPRPRGVGTGSRPTTSRWW